MAQTLTRILIHLIFSTKHRAGLITPDIEPELYAYIGALCRNAGSPTLGIGGTTDHLHILLSLSKTLALADLVMDIKKDSSTWIKTKGAEFRSFHWQDGYAGLSIGESNVGALSTYIARQKQRHRKITFQGELRAILRRYKVPFDERYIWQ